MLTFWDFALLRFHFGCTIVPGGAAWVLRAMTSAYVPLARRQFTIHPSPPFRPLPVLAPLSLWVLTQDCPVGTALGTDAAQGLQAVLASPAGLGLSPAVLADRLAAARPASGQVADATKASGAVGLSYRQRMVQFRSRVRLIAPHLLVQDAWIGFYQLRRLYANNPRYHPDNFPLAWFGSDVTPLLHTGWPSADPSVWDRRPTWIDVYEWQFLLCARGLALTDRLALFLLLYAGLNVRQINRLLLQQHAQSGWRWPDTPAGAAAALDHLTDLWAATLACMALEPAR